jgi:hypothetical protein
VVSGPSPLVSASLFFFFFFFGFAVSPDSFTVSGSGNFSG